VKKRLEKHYGSASKAIIASSTPEELPLRRWLALCGLRGNKGYNRALKRALASLARSPAPKALHALYHVFYTSLRQNYEGGKGLA